MKNLEMFRMAHTIYHKNFFIAIDFSTRSECVTVIMRSLNSGNVINVLLLNIFTWRFGSGS